MSETRAEGFQRMIDSIEQEHLRVKQLELDKARLNMLETTFRHIHVNNQDGTDTCRGCGLDLRDNIHKRLEAK